MINLFVMSRRTRVARFVEQSRPHGNYLTQAGAGSPAPVPVQTAQRL